MNDRLAALRARVAEQNWRLAAAGAAGAAAMLVLFLALWAFGSFAARDDRTVPLAARLVNVELQVRDLAARPQPPAVDPKALADLTARVGSAEQAMARLADFEARVTKAEAAASGAASRAGRSGIDRSRCGAGSRNASARRTWVTG